MFKDAVYVASLAWKQKYVKKEIYMKKLEEYLTQNKIYDGSSDEEKFCGFKVRPQHITDMQRMIETIETGNNAIEKFTENETEKLLDMDKDKDKHSHRIFKKVTLQYFMLSLNDTTVHTHTQK